MSENELQKQKKELSEFWGIPAVKLPKDSEIRIRKNKKNKLNEVIVYVGLYLTFYLIVITLCGVVQYYHVCHGESFNCELYLTGLNTIITTTAYVVTPIVAIIGFLSWKRQHNKETISEISRKIYELIDEQNLSAFHFQGYISDYYKGSCEHENLKRELIEITYKVTDRIRLLCKITNNNKLENLNESNRTAVLAIIMNFEIRKEQNLDKGTVLAEFHSEYMQYAASMKTIRDELSDYILI